MIDVAELVDAGDEHATLIMRVRIPSSVLTHTQATAVVHDGWPFTRLGVRRCMIKENNRDNHWK